MVFGLSSISNLDFVSHFENPSVLLLIVPAVLLIWFLAFKDFVKTDEDFSTRKKRNKLKYMISCLRTITVVLVLVAAAVPFKADYENFEGDPVIYVLEDNSNSMNIFEFDTEGFIQKLQKKTNIHFETFGEPEKSNIGESLLSRIEPFGSILLISDGNANSGASLGDVAVLAASVNATINAIRLDNKRNDLSVKIIGPSKTSEGLEETFIVAVDGVGIKTYELSVSIDGVSVLNKKTSERTTEIRRSFTKGFHTIEARIRENDHFINNNVYYKTIKVVERPKIYYFTNKESPLAELLSQVFRVKQGNEIPKNLNDYYAIVVDDASKSEVDKYTDILTGYVADGNGLLSVGGQSSFDYGGYENSLYEVLLPVFVSSASKKEGENSIVLLLDISGSTGTAFGESTAVDVEKALAVNVFENLAGSTRLAVVAFNTESYLISEPSTVAEKTDFVDKVSRIIDTGGTRIGVGIASSIKLLKNLPGSKNIILISDGKTQRQEEAFGAADTAKDEGIKIYTVGVGERTNQKLMQEIAQRTGGVYFRASDSSNIKLIFGDLEEVSGDSNKFPVVILDKNHFITSSIHPTASITGFNQVVPKQTARLLATTVTGDPVLTVWRLGLGKVAALSTDSGGAWAGELLNRENSELIIKTMNWLIGNPDRKVKDTIDSHDVRLGEYVDVIVRGSNPGNGFRKIDENTFSKTILADTTGIHEESGAKYAVNYAEEYEKIGQGSDIESIVKSTGGKFFNKEDIDDIIDYSKSRTKRQILTKKSRSEPLIIAALALFLLDLLIRRFYRKM